MSWGFFGGLYWLSRWLPCLWWLFAGGYWPGGRAYGGKASGSGLSSVKFFRPVSLFLSIVKFLIVFFISVYFEGSLWFSTGWMSSNRLWTRSSLLLLVTRPLIYYCSSTFSSSFSLVAGLGTSSIHFMARGFSTIESSLFGGGIGPIWEFMKVFLKRSSSQAYVGFWLESSSHLYEIFKLYKCCRRFS